MCPVCQKCEPQTAESLPDLFLTRIVEEGHVRHGHLIDLIEGNKWFTVYEIIGGDVSLSSHKTSSLPLKFFVFWFSPVISGSKIHVLLLPATVEPCIWKCYSQSAGHMHTHTFQINMHTNCHIHTCTHKLAALAHFFVSCTHKTKARFKSADEAHCWTETCHLWGTSQSGLADRQTERQAGRWQHVFVSQSSTSRKAVTAKLEQTILKPKNERSVNNSDGWSFRGWMECVSALSWVWYRK